MRKGFTLIELLIVIAILAILATVVVLVLNPAQLLAEARDGQRLSDLQTVNSAINYYLTTATTPTIASAGPYSTAVAACSFGAACTRQGIYAVDGTGWVGVNFNGASGGSPLSVLPRDPVNTASTSQYSYKGDTTNKTFELNASMESVKFGSGGGNDKVTTDGGSDNSVYEIGTDPGLNL